MYPNISDHPYTIGQPLWVRPEIFMYEDEATYIATGFSRGMLGGWMAHIVPENDLSASPEFMPVGYLTDAMPRQIVPHGENFGSLHWTATGRALRCIDGGRS